MDKYIGLIVVILAAYAAFASATILYLSKAPVAVYYQANR